MSPKGAKPGTLIIDMSSIDPAATKAIAADVAAKGLRWLDCPLSGGAPKALTGQLAVMAGGDPADFEASKAVMRHLCANYTLMGPPGAGQTTKLINQVLCALNFMAVAEATQLALDAGVDAAKIPQAIKGGRADSAILQEFMPQMAVPGLHADRPHRQHGQGSERRAGSRPRHRHRDAADGGLRRNASAADARPAWAATITPR